MEALASDLLHYLQQARDGLLRALDGLPEYDVRRPLTPSGTNLLGPARAGQAPAGVETVPGPAWPRWPSWNPRSRATGQSRRTSTSGTATRSRRLYAEAARLAPNLPERDHLTRQAARLNTALHG